MKSFDPWESLFESSDPRDQNGMMMMGRDTINSLDWNMSGEIKIAFFVFECRLVDAAALLEADGLAAEFDGIACGSSGRWQTKYLPS